MDWKRIGKKLLFPPVYLIVVLVLLSGAALFMVFYMKWETSTIAYIVYVLSFYSLCVLTAWCIMVLPGWCQRIKRAIYETPFGYRYMTDGMIRTKISLHISLTICMLYVGINLWSWYLLHSWWNMVLAVYYVIMAVMRFLLVRYVRIQKIGTSLLGEWKRSRTCGYILLLINVSLSATVLMILYQNRGYDYPGMMIYGMALYTFYSTIHAIVALVKYRNLGSPVMSTVKIVSLSAALVSMLNLETAMFAQFGEKMSVEKQWTFIIFTGAGISVTVVTLAILLIGRANKEIRRLQNGTK